MAKQVRILRSDYTTVVIPFEFAAMISAVEQEIQPSNNMQNHTQVWIANKGIETVSSLFGISVDDLKSNKRSVAIVDAKNTATWIANRMAGLNFGEITTLFGKDPKKHLTTIRSRVETATNMALSYPKFKALIVTTGRCILKEIPHERRADRYSNISSVDTEMLNLIYQPAQSPGSARTQPSPA